MMKHARVPIRIRLSDASASPFKHSELTRLPVSKNIMSRTEIAAAYHDGAFNGTGRTTLATTWRREIRPIPKRNASCKATFVHSHTLSMLHIKTHACLFLKQTAKNMRINVIIVSPTTITATRPTMLSVGITILLNELTLAGHRMHLRSRPRKKLLSHFRQANPT